jgi:ubiquinone/menaquinone biosynthesis C-methylase UbiE
MDRNGEATLRAASFLCPRCQQHVSREGACADCGLALARRGRVLDFVGGELLGGRGEEVRAFYEQRPFPGYAEGDDAALILDRGRRSAFLAGLDAALPPDAAILDCGCGTAQVAMFLALSSSRRRVIGVDGCNASLAEAERFAGRERVDNLELARVDLFKLPLESRAFDFVLCRGVVHHTADPFGAARAVARPVAPGGVLLLGIYESLARRLHRARRGLRRVLGTSVDVLDPILRRRDLDPEKKRTWIEDQYLHPLEHLMSASETVRVLERDGFEFVRTVPPVERGEDLFETTDKPGAFAFLTRRLGWFVRGLNDEDAGLVCVVMRRHRE